MRLKHIHIGEVERLDDHHKAILYFIKNNPQQTENQIVKAMEKQKVCSKMTTLKKLDELIEKVEIKDLLKKGEGGFHKFIINDNNTFNLINNELSELEKIVDSMSQPMKKFRSLGYWREIRQVPDRYIVMDLDDHFVEPYTGSVECMLDILLVLINSKIQSQKDAWFLYSRIIELKIKLNEQNSFDSEGRDSIFNTYNALIQIDADHLSDLKEEIRAYAENKIGISINKLASDLLLRIKNFKGRFLPDYPDITAI
jgi:hypothetical protein